jgi:hypothetical protein
MQKYGSQRWVDILPSIIDNINSSKHSTTGHSPLEVLETPSIRSEVAKNIKDKAAEHKHPVDLKEKELAVGITYG